MQLLQFLSDLFLNLDVTLGQWAEQFGPLVYGLLFAVIFMETGLVVTPFLPGDSLLFAAGTLAAIGSLNPAAVAVTIIVAAAIGDTTNYTIGRVFGSRILASGKTKLVNPEHVERTRGFFARHGGKSVTLARFFPFVRTFAPFMAGIGRMPYPRFALFSFAGTLAWVTIFVGAGYFFGNIPWVQENFEFAVMGIIAVTLAPFAVHSLRSYLAKRRALKELATNAAEELARASASEAPPVDAPGE